MSTEKPSERKKGPSKPTSKTRYADELLRIHGVDVQALRALEARYREEAMPRLAELNAHNIDDADVRVNGHRALLRRLRSAMDLADRASIQSVRSERSAAKRASSGGGRAQEKSSAGTTYWGPPWELAPGPELELTLRPRILGCVYGQYEACAPPLDYEVQDPPTSNPMWVDLASLDIDALQDEPGLGMAEPVRGGIGAGPVRALRLARV